MICTPVRLSPPAALVVSLLLAGCIAADPQVSLSVEDASRQGADLLWGRGVEQDTEQGVALLTRAAEPEKDRSAGMRAMLTGDGQPPEKGCPQAQRILGQIHSLGQGIEQDQARGRELYLRAALQGDGAAQAALGIASERGLGVPTDRIEAYAWFLLADAQDNVDGREGRARLLPLLSPTEREQAVRRMQALARWIEEKR
jgi:uncharacterized protein